ncbi:MAG TPA: hypothetical protein VMV18_00135 [bacterium]|nr:hypothetical protein [bacterium]
MNKFRPMITLAAALAASALVSACGADNKNGATESPTPTSTPAATTGTIAATWSYSGTEAPSRVKLLLIDGQSTGLTCTTLPFAPAAGVLQTISNMPANGAANFTAIQPGAKYIVAAIGENAAGARLASACHDQVNVIAGQTSDVALALLQFVPDMTGTYSVAQNLNIGLPTNVQSALNILAAACGVLNNANLCNVVTQVDQILTSMDVVSQWTLDKQADGSYIGHVKWMTVQGLDVSQIDLVDGSFAMTVNGSETLAYKDFNLTIQFGNLVLFVVQDVLHYDLGSFGTVGSTIITALAGNYVSPMSFTGTGLVSDSNNDGVGDKLQGNLNGHISVSTWNHDFQMDYLATKD